MKQLCCNPPWATETFGSLLHAFGGQRFVQSFPCEHQQAFFEGHFQAYQFFSEIFPLLIYDNLSTAIQKTLADGDKVLIDKGLSF